jgi:hypothetical protein
MSEEKTTNKKWEDRHKMAFTGWQYSVHRIDLLIISISGAGLWLILETLKFSLGKQIAVELPNVWQLKAAGALFVIAIIINFISQFTGKKANYYDMIWCHYKIEYGESTTDPDEIKLINDNDQKAELFSKKTRLLNTLSMIGMLLGLSSVLIYFLFNF